MGVLHYAQSIFGYLPKDVLLYISDKLNIDYNKVHSLVNFYTFFSTEPKGEFKINICVGTACAKKDSHEVLIEFEKQLGIKSNETTKDLKFSLDTTRCLGLCRVPPVVGINGKIYEGVTPKDVSLILNEYS
ncbi:MAG: NAD(P)H-dependent oxidoreductase subunit E, partial [Terrisporobacter sp.]